MQLRKKAWKTSGLYGIWALEFHAIPLQHSTNWAIWLVSSTVECCTVIVEVNGLIPEYTSLNFFRLSFQNCKVSVYNCNDLSFNSQGFWYFAEKKAKFRGIFRGKFAEKSADFAGFSREESQNSRKDRPISGIFARKSQNSQKNRPISRDFRGKKSNFEGFSEANS